MLLVIDDNFGRMEDNLDHELTEKRLFLCHFKHKISIAHAWFGLFSQNLFPYLVEISKYISCPDGGGSIYNDVVTLPDRERLSKEHL